HDQDHTVEDRCEIARRHERNGRTRPGGGRPVEPHGTCDYGAHPLGSVPMTLRAPPTFCCAGSPNLFPIAKPTTAVRPRTVMYSAVVRPRSSRSKPASLLDFLIFMAITPPGPRAHSRNR